jgi:pilus assembly protein CpaB
MASQTISKPRGEKSQRYVFFLGLALAAIAAIIAFVAVSSGGSSGGDVAVVVAKETIPAQTRVTTDMLAVQYLSSDDANSDAFASRAQVIDRVTTEEITAGAQVLPSMVSEVTGDGLPFKVEPGMRAVSVEVREVTIAGGNIKPGDRVDIVGIFEVENAEVANHLLKQLGTAYTVEQPALATDTSSQEGANDDLVLTVTLLQNVKVIGLAQTLTPDSGGGGFAEEVEEADTEPRAATATLQVTPAQAQAITMGDEYGIIRLGARPAGEDESTDIQPIIVPLNRTR